MSGPVVVSSVTQLGLEIGKARVSGGLSQCELARRIGVKQPTLSKWELGQCAPRLDDLLNVLAAAGLELVVRPRRERHRVTSITTLRAVIERAA